MGQNDLTFWGIFANPLFNRQKKQLVFFFYFHKPNGMKHTVQDFLLHHDLLGVLIFHIMEKGLFIVQMIKSKANNVCMRGQDN